VTFSSLGELSDPMVLAKSALIVVANGRSLQKTRRGCVFSYMITWSKLLRKGIAFGKHENLKKKKH